MEANGPISPVLSISSRSRSSSSDDDSSDDEGGWKGGCFIDFESDDSIPNLIVKSFLRDCVQHPKILLHKDFEFFRGYLSEVGLKFEIPANSPVSENHDHQKFCVDKGDLEWLQTLKERVKVNSENPDFYWASIMPVRRRDDLGLVIFKWELHPLSIHFLQLYITFCRRRMSEMVSEKTNEFVDQDMENVDEYIKDFLSVFEPNRNMDVEDRRKAASDASAYRKQHNLQEPSRTDLLYLFRRQPKPTESQPTASKSRARNKRKYNSSESDSSSASSESSWGSEYKGKYSVRGHRKTNKRKVAEAQNSQPVKCFNRRVARKASLPPRIKELMKRLPLREVKIVLTRYNVTNIVSDPWNRTFASEVPPSPKPSTSSSSASNPKLSGEGNEPILLEITNEGTQKTLMATPSDEDSKAEPNAVTINEDNEKSSVSTTVASKIIKNPTSTASTAPVSKHNGMISAETICSNDKQIKKMQQNFPCEICWFGKSFPTEKLLQRHMDKDHSPSKRELVACGCGLRMKKASLELHEQICIKTIINGVKRRI